MRDHQAILPATRSDKSEMLVINKIVSSRLHFHQHRSVKKIDINHDLAKSTLRLVSTFSIPNCDDTTEQEKLQDESLRTPEESKTSPLPAMII